jgi:hypothetical protein
MLLATGSLGDYTHTPLVRNELYVGRRQGSAHCRQASSVYSHIAYRVAYRLLSAWLLKYVYVVGYVRRLSLIYCSEFAHNVSDEST